MTPSQSPCFRRAALVGKFPVAGLAALDDSRALLADVASFLEKCGCEVVLEASTAANLDHPHYPALGVDALGTGCDVCVVLGGDGVPCEGLDALCLGADAYVQTVIRDDLVKLVPSARLQDILDYHSSVGQAGETATRAGVRHLVLTHYVPSMQPGQEDEWRALAAATFDGNIVLGDDLTTLEI